MCPKGKKKPSGPNIFWILIEFKSDRLFFVISKSTYSCKRVGGTI
jgi:hypothetical protein